MALAYLAGSAVIVKARNALINYFREMDGTHLLMLDADTLFDAQDVVRLVRWTGC